MPAPKSARPLYAEFLARVIKIDAVQCHRAAVTDKYTERFFEEGRRPGAFGDFFWSLDKPEDFPWGPLAPATGEKAERVSPAMEKAWEAAVKACRAFIDALRNGELIATGRPPEGGAQCDLDPAEWKRDGLILDVRKGDLYEVSHGLRSLRWDCITLRAVKKRSQKTERGHGYDWDGAWAYAKSLRAEDQWDWTKHRRDKKQPLPALHKTVEDKINQWFVASGSVPNIRDIRTNIIIPLYAGRRKRGKRKR